MYRHLADPVPKDTREVAADALSDMIVICYLLGKRLGIDYYSMERNITKKSVLASLMTMKLKNIMGTYRNWQECVLRKISPMGHKIYRRDENESNIETGC